MKKMKTFRLAGLSSLVAALVMLLAGCDGHGRRTSDPGKTTPANEAGGAVSATKQVWTCPMHPEIIRDKPGTCPICGMDLVRKETNAARLEGIQMDDLLQPMDRFVVSSLPVTAIKRQWVPMETQALGTIGYDTRLVNTISARVSGRIEKLYVHYRYQHVHKGDRLMDIYSPELVTGEQDLLFLLKHDPDNAMMIDAAKQRLLLLGMSERQLQAVITAGNPAQTVAVYSLNSGHIHEAGNTMPAVNGPTRQMDRSGMAEEFPVKEGMYVEKGQTVFQLFNTDRSWILLHLFPGQAAAVKVGNAVRVVPETAPDQDFRGKLDFIEPFYREGEKTLVARVYFDNTVLQLPIGSQVKATIFGGPVAGDWLPKDAVLSLGMDQVVFVRADGGFKAHKVMTGVTYKDRVQVLSGLTETDSVAANAQYLMDSESFIKVKK
jgi:Cu(I)/Ag(I) efflux system membrane fusion protein